MKYYPLFMNIEGRECLVVGAGEVAARKARGLLECGARVTVVGENPVPSLRRLRARGLRLRARAFRTGDLKDQALVFGATDDQSVNRDLSRRSLDRGLPVNIADDPDRSTFILPSVYRRRDLTVAVSTAGKSPAAAAMLREEIGERFGADYAALVSLLGAYRGRMMASVPGHRRRAQVWKKILASEVPSLMKRGDRRGAARIIRRHIREAAISAKETGK